MSTEIMNDQSGFSKLEDFLPKSVFLVFQKENKLLLGAFFKEESANNFAGESSTVSVKKCGVADVDGVLTPEQRKYYSTLVDQNRQLLEAVTWFCERVEKGEVRSRKTYSRFKELIENLK